jgi:hypothetical protein
MYLKVKTNKRKGSSLGIAMKNVIRVQVIFFFELVPFFLAQVIRFFEVANRWFWKRYR